MMLDGQIARNFLSLMLGVTSALVAWSSEPVRADADSVPAAERDTERTSREFAETVKPFLATYCGRCHGAKTQKGERRFDRLDHRILDDNRLVDFQDILDQLNLSEMPPAEERQPPGEERRQVILWLTHRIRDHHATGRRGDTQTVLRRLNAREYRNTIRDLLRLDMTMFDPTSSFPREQAGERPDTDGEALVTSGHLLARYLEAAERSVEKALFPLEKPAVQKWVFRDNFRQQPEIDQVHRKTNEFRHMTLYDVVGADKHEGAYGPILAFKSGVPVDGTYRVRLKAEALNRQHPYDPAFLGTDPDEPLRLGIVAGNHLVGQLHKPQPVEPLLAEWELADRSEWYTTEIRLDAGYTPRFTFRNGLMDVRNLWSRLLRKYPEQFPKRKRGGIVESRFNAIKYGKLPQIHIHEIEIEGPLYDRWPTASQRAALGPECAEILAAGEITETEAAAQLTRFLARAYRRPPRDEEVRRLLKIMEVRQQAGRTSLESFADVLNAALCSPNFLYMEEAVQGPEAGQPGRHLTSWALASRLSYFLWSSMPDQELRNLAENDALLRRDVLESQVDRLLDDPKSDAWIEGFLASWLTLRDLGSTPPDRNQFREFYHYDLDSAMRRETQLFVRHLLDENLSIVHFLDADFTFVNKPLARLYGIEPPADSEFERVKLPDRRRGGLLGQASILTVTANGIDTSPVVRGVWLLETILGTPPSPPPPDVEPLDPDVRGATTIRDQLEKHRSVSSCRDCHQKIDPLGFALENFDPIGRWRDRYERNAPVDASGELPNGRSFDDVGGLKTILVEQKEQFARALTEKLLAYALGRRLAPGDRPAVDEILKALRQRDYRMRDLMALVVLSDTFASE